MSELFNNLMALDFARLWDFLADVLRNPTSNIVAFMLILAAITVVMLVVIAILLLLFMGGDEEEVPVAQVPATPTKTPSAPVARPAPEPPSSSVEGAARYFGLLLWIAAIAVIWVAGGWVTSQDTFCTSCHLDDSIHIARIDETGEDPHDPVRCVSCHESPWSLAALTTSVPGRAVHFTAGVVYTSWADGYGSPVENRTCGHCHSGVLVTTVENEERGIRVSHEEPLAAKARCLDCHVPQEGTGVISGLTVGMSTCIRCHDARTASAECNYCHTKDVGYAMQARGTLKPVSHSTELDCGGCHDEEKECDTCHGMRMPHSQHFMSWGHARTAVEDIWYNGGELCTRCHTPQRRSCQNCHGGTFPAHPLTYMPKGHQTANPYSNSCDNACHVRLRWDANRNFCGNCHAEYAGIKGDYGNP